MKWNLTAINATLILYAFLLGLLFFLTKTYYWEFLDFLVYPLADNINFEADVDQNTDLFIIKIIGAALLDPLKSPFLNFLMFTTGYNLILPVAALFGFITCCSLFYFFKNPTNSAAVLSIAICFVFLGLAGISDTPVMKWEVNTEFKNFNYEDVTGVDYIKLLRNEEYDVLDKILGDVEFKYLSGGITEQQYTYEYDKFDNKNINESDLVYFDHWVKNSSSPEYPLTARGIFYEKLGWRSRGNKWSKDTSEEQFKQMREYFLKATSDHNEALSINSKRLFSYVSLINIAKAGDKNGVDEKNTYARANAEFPSSYYLNYRYMNNKQPKWGGSFLEMRTLVNVKRNNASTQPKLIALGGLEASYRANGYWVDKNYDEAIRWYKRALLYAPRTTIYRKIGELYAAKKDYLNAIATLSEGLNTRPNDALLLVYRAKYYALTGDLTHAANDAKIASNLSIKNAWTLGTLGWVLEKTKNYKKSVVIYKRSLDANPEYIYALKRLFSLSYGQNKAISYEDVLPYMKHWTSIEPENPKAWISYADTMEDLEPQQAIHAYEKYLDLVDHKNKDYLEQIKAVEATLERIKKSGT